MQKPKQGRKLPEWAMRHFPQRAKFKTPQEYQEAVAFFHHRFKHLAR